MTGQSRIIFHRRDGSSNDSGGSRSGSSNNQDVLRDSNGNPIINPTTGNPYKDLGNSNFTPGQNSTSTPTPNPPTVETSSKLNDNPYVDLFQGKNSSTKNDSAIVYASPALLAKAGVQGQSRPDVSYALISQRQEDKNKKVSVDYEIKAQNEFVGPKQGTESVRAFTGSILRGGAKTTERVTEKSLPGVSLANQFFLGKKEQSTSEFLSDGDVKKTGSLVTGPYFNIVQPSIFGTAKIIREEVKPTEGRFGFSALPDFSLDTAKRRLKLSEDKDVQVAETGAAFILLGAAGKGGALVARITGGLAGGYEVFKGFEERNPAKIGTGLFLIKTSEPLGAVKRVATEIFGERISPDTVTGKSVTSRSVEESLVQFKEYKTPSGGYEVVSASPNKLVGDLKAGPKGEAGLEDPGLYVAPKGRANLMFAGIESAGKNTDSISLLPTLSGRPTVNVFEVQDIVRLPREAILEPGFRSSKQEAFRLEASKYGEAIITKRSEIGKGAIERQLFTPFKDFDNGKLVRKKGQFYREAGTSESEAVLPEGSVYVSTDKGLKQRFRYTVVNPKKIGEFEVPFTGELIRVPRYKVRGEADVDFIRTQGKRVVSEEFIKSKDTTVSSFIENRRSVPFRSVPASKIISDSSEKSQILSTPRSLVSRTSSNKSVPGSLVSSDFSSGESLLSSNRESKSNRSLSDVSSPSIVGSSSRNLSTGKSLYSSKGLDKSSYSDLRQNTQVKSIRFDSDKSKSLGRFSVELRRFGEFRRVGFAKSLDEANRLGALQAKKTLGATYRVRSGSGFVSVRAPTGFYNKGKDVIEKNRYRLNTGSEVSEIGFFKNNKRRNTRVSV